MAQKKAASASRSGSGAKKPTSTARNTGGTKKTSSSTRSGSHASAGKTSQKKTQARAVSTRSGGAKAAQPEPRRPIRREVGCFVLLFVGLVALISYFPVEGWLVEDYRALMQGLFGWGFYLTPIALLWGSAILCFHRGRPVRLRVTCALLLPAVFGAFIHMLLFAKDGLFEPGFGYGVKELWRMAQDATEHCGGVMSGILGILLKKSIGVVGSFLVLAAAFALLVLGAMNIQVPELVERIKNRPRPAYEPEPDPDELDDGSEDDGFFTQDDYLYPLNTTGRTSKKEPSTQAKAAARAKTPARRAFYDEDWERSKDRLFAEMDVDPLAAMHVAAALDAEQERKNQKPAPKPEKPAKPAKAEKPKPAKKETDAASLTENVKPLDLAAAADIAGVEIHSADLDGGAAAPESGEKMKIDKDAEAELVAQEIAQAEEDKAEYVFPAMDMLNKSDPAQTVDGEDVDETEVQLENAIRSFGVGASITGAVRGPTVTRYELKLDQGVKLNKITNLAGDIALSLGVSNVRIAPIQDKISTVGVEVPNRKVTTVWLGDVIDSDAFKNAKSKLSVAVGKDIGGNVIVGNISKMPHVLIAGTTGSGKSVCINSLILSLLYKSTPDEVRMIMIDPKMVELGIYNGMPHLYVPVVTDPKKAAGALQWSVVEMLKRYRLFSECGVRDLPGYNAIQKSRGEAALPQVVIIIDELADLMMVASKEVEESICRVAQMGRAAGMHLVVATQRPSADVITGLMKANIPSRIAFAVSSALESRIILDQQGAEKLIGAGDMLYSPIGIGKPVRVQGAFVTDEEREEIVNFVKREAEAEYSDEILAEIEKAAEDKDKKGKGGEDDKDDGKGKNDYDELLPQAVDVIFETKQASVSMLQRRLKLGYSRAARLIDQLEEVGVVGPYEGSKPRQIVITKQQWQEMQYSQGTAPVDTIAQEFAQVAESDEFAPTDEELTAEAAAGEADTPDDGEDELL